MGPDETVASTAEAVADMEDGASLAVGGFGPCGTPGTLIDALGQHGLNGLEIVSSDRGVHRLRHP